MRYKIKALFFRAAVTLIIVISTTIFAAAQAQPRAVSDGEKVKILGFINTRDAEAFGMVSPNGQDVYRVIMTPGTEVKTHKKGVFRGGKEYPSSYLLRGLRVEVEGVGDAAGQLVAQSVKFDEEDLRTAQALAARVDPVEAQANSNTSRLTESEKNAKRLEEKIDDNTVRANSAQETADAALQSATRANNRINGLDSYDPVKTITVVFATGSSVLGPKGRGIIDQAAAWVRTQNTKGWMVSVVGYADSTGNQSKNKVLSEKRANSVIGYLVSKHGLPITRLIQPFGAGDTKPVASNSTATGRAQNRRVEIHLMVNRGIAG